MAEENQTDSPEEVTLSIPAHSQPPTTHAPPPPNLARIQPVYSSEPSASLPPSASMGALVPHSGFPPPPMIYVPPPPATQALPLAQDTTCVAALEGNFTMLQGAVDLMAANIAEMMPLLRHLNRASSSSTPPLAQRSTVDPTPWFPLTHMPEGNIADALVPTVIPTLVPPSTHLSAIYLVDTLQLLSTILTFVSLSPMTIPMLDSAMFAPSPVSVPAPATIYTVLSPMVFLASSAPVPIQATKPFPFPTLQPYIGLPNHAPPPINIHFPEPGTLTHATLVAPPTNFLPEAKTEQERRMRKMEETIRALQVGDPRHSTSHLDLTLFPGMRLPPKIKILNFQKFDRTKDLRHHLCYYHGKMLQYWDYEQFVIATFQESLSGPAPN
ncbi:hypothetical protein CRG98_047310 [Punica granatum]|uniref:Extensin-like n=1 Tax=Punica granatum TaxID=22663 RepID=A0A2I0HKW5_PUNGR|nr:hypothetical protein CRG98_047310 [Punica granatum]